MLGELLLLSLPALQGLVLHPASARGPVRTSVAQPHAARAGSVPSCSADTQSLSTAEPALAVLKEAARTKEVSDDKVVGALLDLEQAMRAAAKDDPKILTDTLENLHGAWRLVFTTGTVDTQKRSGSVSYFPVKAVQTFDTKQTPMRITNGIFLGEFAALKFFGEFEWEEKKRRLNFDFDAISVFGLRINLPKGGAAQIGASSGLGSKSNVQLAAKEKKAFFNWISADDDVATARGGGGGLALWRRDLEIQKDM